MFGGFGRAMGMNMGGGSVGKPLVNRQPQSGIGPSPGMMGGRMGAPQGRPTSLGQQGPNPFAQMTRGLGQGQGQGMPNGIRQSSTPYGGGMGQGSPSYNPSQMPSAQTQGGPTNIWGGQMGPSGGLMQQLMQRIQQQGMPGGYKPPQPGDMVNNGWGGQMPYDPNRTAIS